jgi:ketosteroid isomerase-like protein
MTVMELALAFAALLREGKEAEAAARFNAPDIVSLEAMDGPMARAEGAEAVARKAAWWTDNHTVHDARVEGPWPHGDQFALKFWIDVTPRDGARMQMDEIGLYTVRDGRIVEERFFYAAG